MRERKAVGTVGKVCPAPSIILESERRCSGQDRCIKWESSQGALESGREEVSGRGENSAARLERNEQKKGRCRWGRKPGGLGRDLAVVVLVGSGVVFQPAARAPMIQQQQLGQGAEAGWEQTSRIRTKSSSMRCPFIFSSCSRPDAAAAPDSPPAGAVGSDPRHGPLSHRAAID